ncbi:MAG: Zn-dependent hydrolase, partial [Flavobacteriaceae bacterium]|nr:Zn-dependent hydrolase [Flavobacteriaceae bacterium]
MRKMLYVSLIGLLLVQCGTSEKKEEMSEGISPMKERVNIYKNVKLTADLSSLSENDKKMIPLMIEASQIMDELFWYEAYGKKDSLLLTISDPDTKAFVQINYGPWDRLA